MDHHRQTTEETALLPTSRLVTHRILAQEVPDVFDAAATVYIYDPRTDTGRWVSPGDELYRQWQDSHGLLPLKLFEIGSLPVCALQAAADQGIHGPYWRGSLRKLQGWVICQARIEPIERELWYVAYTRVFYSLDGKPSEYKAPVHIPKGRVAKSAEAITEALERIEKNVALVESDLKEGNGDEVQEYLAKIRVWIGEGRGVLARLLCDTQDKV